MPPVFPNVALGLKVELLLGGVWTDVTAYVRGQTVSISNAGRADWTSTLQAAQMVLTLDNRTGRFTPKYSSGAYYPNIVRNVQVRASVASQSVTGVSYSGYRFFGEVAEWPPGWDVSGRNVYTTITANGPWRRYSQLATPLGSAYRRFTSALSKRSYWPMEDGTGSGQLVPYGSAATTSNAVQSFTAGQAGLSLASNTDFRGSDGIPTLNAAKIVCTVPSGGTATNNETRFLMSVPAAGDSASGTTNWNLAEIASAGTVAKFEVYLNYAGTVLVQLRNSGGTVIASGTTTTNVKGQPYLASCELTPSGGNVAWAFRLIQPGAAGITESMTGTVSTASVGQVSTVTFSRANVLMDTAVGHCSVTYASPASMVSAASALAGYPGEKAADRFTRICGELGIAAELVGTAASSAAMGPQVDGTLADLLQSIEDTDMGLLFESRGQFGLGYRCLNSMTDQSADATFNYAGAPGIDPSLSPVYDDSLTRNNVTITNWTGYSQQAIITTGPMSVSSPPNGIGNGYGYTRQVNANADSQLPGIASWLINLGGCDEIRIPVITVKLARAAAASMFATIPGMFIGDYLQITNMPSGWWPSGTVKQLIWGYSEVIAPKQWDISFNTVPESPYETGFSPGTVTSAQIPGGSQQVSTAPGAGGLAGLLTNGLITPAMLSEGITVKNLGGTRTTIAASAPSNPDTNDIWIDSGTGLISQWNGSSWVPFKFDASATIQAASIVTANIAASAITSSLIAAGTVVAGIVDTTTVLANLYIATSSGGEFLAYDTSSPSSGHLINSIAGASGTDGSSNAYPKGLMSQQLTLVNQGSAPPAFSGASVLYSSVAGRPRYLSSAGADSVIERSEVNVAQFSMGTQTIATTISAALNYQAGEANQSSEYELEIDGIITTPTGGTGTPTYTMQMMIDGATAGGAFTIGGVMLPHNVTLSYTVRFRLHVVTTGAGGTCNMISDGQLSTQGVNIGSTTSPVPTAAVGAVGLNKAFDTTSSHTLRVFGLWASSSATGYGVVTYRTKIGRRM